ncbi:folate family ECF transporter S component [Spiroplasma endosymbiont of Labia minor]|uniref:folate family ECF transporter S component n=1 Tax=Spiroplasma endosymbiont of Labia minor TaxID=3066305 RepID=UPI0030D42D55
MLYVLTNLFAVFGVIILFVISLSLEKWTFKKLSIRIISIMGIMTALSVILTNLISYNIPLMGNKIMLALGDWILFLNGMIFGPIAGIITAVATDSIGSVINVGGGYHAGFMFDKSLLAISGSFIFLMSTNKNWYFHVIWLYCIAFFIISFLLNSIWLYASGWTDLVFINVIFKLIKFPIEIIIYPFFVISSFSILKIIIQKWTQDQIWCLRKGTIPNIIKINRFRREYIEG